MLADVEADADAEVEVHNRGAAADREPSNTPATKGTQKVPENEALRRARRIGRAAPKRPTRIKPGFE